MKNKPKPQETESSYLRQRDRNGCIGCMGVFACIVIFAFWLTYFG